MVMTDRIVKSTMELMESDLRKTDSNEIELNSVRDDIKQTIRFLKQLPR